MAITKINGGVTAPKGFLASGLNAGIKNQTKKDMAMVFSSTPCAAAGVFTTNLVKAAPVKWDKEIVTTSPYVQAVVVNSGIANACTGAEGLGYCADTAAEAAAALNIPKTAVLVASTGVIGKQLPIDKIKSGVTALSKVLGSSREDAKLAAEAIMTTDTKSKEVAAKRLIKIGIRGIWNFAHTDLRVPDDVVVENVHLSESLMRISYRLSNQED